MSIENENKSSQLKNKERITINFRKKPAISIAEVYAFIEVLNKKDFGKDIEWADIIAYFIKNHTENDIQNLQESSMTLMDKIRQKYQREKDKTGVAMSFEEFLAKKTKVN